jgi:hypothetical protein
MHDHLCANVTDDPVTVPLDLVEVLVAGFHFFGQGTQHWPDPSGHSGLGRAFQQGFQVGYGFLRHTQQKMKKPCLGMNFFSLPHNPLNRKTMAKAAKKAAKKSAAGRGLDRAFVAGGQDYEVAYEAKKAGKTARAVKKAIKKVGNSRKKVNAALTSKSKK